MKVLFKLKRGKTIGRKKHLIENDIIELSYLIINLSGLLLSKSQESSFLSSAATFFRTSTFPSFIQFSTYTAVYLS